MTTRRTIPRLEGSGSPLASRRVRLIPGLGLEVEAEVRAIETDKMCAEVEALLDDISTGPWLADTKKNAGQNWLLATFGADFNGNVHIVTTDHVHASELTGDAGADARFVALARTLLPLLIDERKRRSVG